MTNTRHHHGARLPDGVLRRAGRLAGTSALAAAVIAFPAFLGTAAHAEPGVTEIPSSYLPEGIACDWYSGAGGQSGSALYGVQCTVVTSFGGGVEFAGEPDPIPLVPSADTDSSLIYDINTWLADNGISSSIDAGSLVGIETIGGTGRNGDSCGGCSSGDGADPGYAITVQSLGGMQQAILNSGFTSNGSPVPPALYVLVGHQGDSAASNQGGGGGSATWVTGVWPNILSIPDTQTPDDAIVFAIGGGGGGGGGVFGSSGSGKHGGHGGNMTALGPVTTGDTTVAGEDGSGGSRSGGGGSETADGAAGSGGGDENDGTSGIGGQGGLKSDTAGFVGTAFAWPYGHGGSVGGDKATGGGGGGGWGGGGGGGQQENSAGNFVGRGGGGGGSWARESVSDSASLPTLYNVRGQGFGLHGSDFSTAVLSFSLDPTGPAVAPSTVQECHKGAWATFVEQTFRNQGDCVSYVKAHGKK